MPAALTKKDLRSAHAFWLPKELQIVPTGGFFRRELALTKKALRSAHAFWLPKEGLIVPKGGFFRRELALTKKALRSAHAFWLPQEGLIVPRGGFFRRGAGWPWRRQLTSPAELKLILPPDDATRSVMRFLKLALMLSLLTPVGQRLAMGESKPAGALPAPLIEDLVARDHYQAIPVSTKATCIAACNRGREAMEQFCRSVPDPRYKARVLSSGGGYNSRVR